MKDYFFIPLIGLFLAILSIQIEAKNTLLVTDLLSPSALNSATQYLEVPANQDLDIYDVQSFTREQWASGTSSVPNFGYTDNVFWFKLQIKSPAGAIPGRYFYRVNYAVLDSIHFYLEQGGRIVSQQITGDTFPFDSRLVKTNTFAHPIDIMPGEALTLYVRVKSQGTVQLPATLLTEGDFHSESLSFYIAQGIFFGVVGIMLLYNFLLFFAFRAKEYLLYVFYGASVLLLLSTKHGLSFQYLWSQSTWWNNKAIPLSMCLCSLFLLAFTYYFLNIQQHSQRLSKAFITLIIALICLAVFDLYVSYGLAIKLSAIGTGIAIIACVIGSITAWKNNDPNVKQYIVSWLAMLAGAMVLLLTMFGLLPINALTQHAWQIGSGLEIVILSFALANKIRTVSRKINRERKRRFEMQLSISEELEKQVKERTATLQKTMGKLEAANTQLQEIATKDGLTGLANRRHFNSTIENEWKRCRRTSEPLSLIMLDIDHFKQFNDSFGHQVGDECLQLVSRHILKGCRRPADTAARYGGEEFAIILPNTNISGAVLVAEKIRSAIQQIPFPINKKSRIITVSVGVACLSEEIANAETKDLIKAADDALYQAKGNGRNQVICA